jgi:hypothetical protein
MPEDAKLRVDYRQQVHRIDSQVPGRSIDSCDFVRLNEEDLWTTTLAGMSTL